MAAAEMGAMARHDHGDRFDDSSCRRNQRTSCWHEYGKFAQLHRPFNDYPPRASVLALPFWIRKEIKFLFPDAELTSAPRSGASPLARLNSSTFRPVKFPQRDSQIVGVGAEAELHHVPTQGCRSSIQGKTSKQKELKGSSLDHRAVGTWVNSRAAPTIDVLGYNENVVEPVSDQLENKCEGPQRA